MPVDNLQQFRVDLAKEVALTNAKVRGAIRRIGAETLRGVVMLTRVDTGRARASWQLTHGKPATMDPGPDHTDRGGSQTVRAGIERLKQTRIGVDIYITSNLPYIEKLEELDHMASLTAHRVETTFSRVNV